jgi:hypothetical protein
VSDLATALRAILLNGWFLFLALSLSAPILAGWAGTRLGSRPAGLGLVAGVLLLLLSAIAMFAYTGFQTGHDVTIALYGTFAQWFAGAALFGTLVGAAIVYW